MEVYTVMEKRGAGWCGGGASAPRDEAEPRHHTLLRILDVESFVLANPVLQGGSQFVHFCGREV